MESVKIWVKELLVLVLLISFTEMLLPTEKYRKFLGLAAGMCMMLVIMRPFSGICISSQTALPAMNLPLFTGENRQVNEEIVNKILAVQLGRQLKHQLKEELNMDAEVNIELSAGERKISRVVLNAVPDEKDSAQAAMAVQKLLSKQYAVAAENVKINWE